MQLKKYMRRSVQWRRPEDVIVQVKDEAKQRERVVQRLDKQPLTIRPFASLRLA